MQGTGIPVVDELVQIVTVHLPHMMLLGLSITLAAAPIGAAIFWWLDHKAR